MRDLASIKALEDRILLYADCRGALEPRIKEEVEERCRGIFGVADCDTEFVWPADAENLTEDDDAYWHIAERERAHEMQFELASLHSVAAAARLLELGLDFRGADGQPLRCLSHVKRSAEAAVKRLKGFKTKLPTAEDIAVLSFEESIAAEAAAFLKAKRRG